MRHGDKKYNNKSSFPERLDSPLIDDIGVIHENLKIFFEKNDLPSQIITSPFLRTRQTALIVKNYIKKEYDIDLEIKISNEIVEYLGNVKQLEFQDFNKTTLKYYTPYIESIKQLNKRISKFKDNLTNNLDKTLFVTHGFFIKKLLNSTKYPSCGQIYYY
jgi:broad specificity phosphatase PhoE